MSAQNKSTWRLRFLALQTVGWALLVPGFVLVGKSALEFIGMQHMTANSLSWSSAGLLLLLIGSLMNSCRKDCELNLTTPADSKH